MGLSDTHENLQVDYIDEVLQNELWNIILTSVFDNREIQLHIRHKVCLSIWAQFFHKRIDEVPHDKHVVGFTPSGDSAQEKQRKKDDIDGIKKYTKDWFVDENTQWYEKYDLIEFILPFFPNTVRSFNNVLERELSAYRIVNHSIVQIASPIERKEIERIFNSNFMSNHVKEHIDRALEKISNKKRVSGKEKGDYSDSVKDSILAVEAICCEIVGDEDATLGDALNKIGNHIHINPALQKAFKIIYGYTSNSGGIRHALSSDDHIVSIEDARFMLVACSAFTNYLLAKKLKSSDG